MATITLQNSSLMEVTILSNTFIDNYMPEANGEFVKVYIYLLRSLSNAPVSFSLEQMADRLLCTERDILRALKYWAKQELIALDFTDSNKLCGIVLLSPDGQKQTVSSVSASRETASAAEQPAVSPASASVSVSAPETSTDEASVKQKQELTPDRIRELKQNEEVSQLLYIAEQYLAKTLTPTEMQKIFFFYDELHMSADLIEYLVEYCVSRGRKSMRYIETVALAWTRDGVTTVEMARDASSRFSKDYYTILKAMGISGRNPVENEISYIDTWRKTYGFDLELIQEACSRTVLSTGQPSFQYADKILSGWKKKNVHTLEDVRLLDAEHKKRQLEKAVSRKKQPAAQSQSNNRFNNFHQRDYDFTEYEKRLLNNQ